MVAEGAFREDLFYRLNVVSINLPGLRERKDDIPLLVKYFVDLVCKDNNRNPLQITPSAMDLLEKYDYPGNIRELRNTVERMVVLARNETLDVSDIPPQIREYQAQEPSARIHPPADKTVSSEKLDLNDNERKLIEQALISAGGNRTRAAEILGISRRTLHRRLN